jgi:hypothetical protein
VTESELKATTSVGAEAVAAGERVATAGCATASAGNVNSIGSADHQTNFDRNAVPPAPTDILKAPAYRTSGALRQSL